MFPNGLNENQPPLQFDLKPPGLIDIISWRINWLLVGYGVAHDKRFFAAIVFEARESQSSTPLLHRKPSVPLTLIRLALLQGVRGCILFRKGRSCRDANRLGGSEDIHHLGFRQISTCQDDLCRLSVDPSPPSSLQELEAAPLRAQLQLGLQPSFEGEACRECEG